MSQNQIVITSGVTTHENVLDGMNSNFSDSEIRISSLELVSGDSLVSGDNVSLLTNDVSYMTSTQQSISSVSSGVTLDNSLGGNADITLTEDVTGLSIINSTSGDSGLIVIEQDGLGPWTFSTIHPVYAGDLADIATAATGQATIGWYNDGSEYKLYVSNFVE